MSAFVLQKKTQIPQLTINLIPFKSGARAEVRVENERSCFQQEYEVHPRFLQGVEQLFLQFGLPSAGLKLESSDEEPCESFAAVSSFSGSG